MNPIGVPELPGSMNRRAMLIFSGAVALSLTGCTQDGPQTSGRGRSSAPAPQTPTPTPVPGTVEAAERENDLAAFSAAALDRFEDRLSAADRNLLTNLRDAHLAHAAVLTQPNPPAPSASTPAAPPALGHGPKAARARLKSLETKAAKAYSGLALSPTGPEDHLGDLALLWASLATASTCYAAACSRGSNPGSEVVGDHRTNVAVAGPDTAVHDLLEQCYAIIFGYQTALAALSGSRADHARSRMAGYRDLRDQLADQLSDQRLPVPAPHAAYRLPVQPTSDTRSAQLIGRMESRMLPYLGQWLRTASSDDRRRSLDTMIETAQDAQTWSPKIIVWPGYSIS